MILAQGNPGDGTPLLLAIAGIVCLYYGYKRLRARKTWGWILSGVGLALILGVSIYTFGLVEVLQWIGDKINRIIIFFENLAN